MEDLLVKYGIVFGKRYTLKQRQNFLLAINEEFTKLDYPTKFANDEKRGNARTVDFFVGDIASADTIVCTHHDTPLMALWPNYRYYPLNGPRSFKRSWTSTLLPSLIATVIGALVIYLIIINPDFGGTWRRYLMPVSVLLAFLLATMISRSFSNKYNINRNTASVLTILETAKQLDKNARRKIAFVLLDKGCSDHNGAQLLKQALPTTMDRKLFIYLDCIGNGDNLQIAHKENLSKEAKRLIQALPDKNQASISELDDGDLVYTAAYFFKRALVITNGKLDKDGYLYVDKVNSGADKFADTNTIKTLASSLATFLNK